MNRKKQTAVLFLLTAMLAISVAAQMAHWSFNTIGSTVFDDSGHGINGTIVGLNPGLDDGVSGYSTDIAGNPVTDGVVSWPNTYSYRFAKGVGQIILTNNLHLLNLTSMPVRVTIEAFFKLNSTRLPMRILHLENKTNDAPQTQISPFLSPVEPAPLPAMTIQSDNTTNYVTVFANAVDPTPVAVKQWHHMAIVIDGTNFTFYLDYQLIEIENADTFTAGPFKDFDKAGLGCAPGSSVNDFDGWLDDIRITQAVLSST